MTDVAETLDSARRDRRFFVIGMLAVAVLSLALNFYRLGAPSLKDSDEAIEALTSREMLQTGDWLTPRLNGGFRYTKPPLYFWLTAGTFLVVGQTDLALRFWSGAAGAGTVLLTGLIGRRLFGARAGVFAALALATSARFVYYHGARNCCLDPTATFWIALGMLCVVSRRAHPRLLILAGIAFGLASLTKNFLGLPAAALVGIHLFATRRANPPIPPRLIWGATAMLLALSVAWPAAMLILHGRAFAEVFLLRENLGRFNLGGGRPLPWKTPRPLSGRVGVLARTLFDGFFPWSLLAPLIIAWVLRRLPEWRHDDRALSAGWIGLYAAGMLAATNPTAWYGYPFYPAVAILIGVFVQRLLAAGRHSVALTTAAGALAAGALLFRPRWSSDCFLWLWTGASIRFVSTGAVLILPIALGVLLVCLILLRPRWGRTLLVAELTAVSAAFALAPLRLGGEVLNSELLARRIEAIAPSYGNAVTFWNFPSLAPTGEVPGVWCEARWYLQGLHGVRIYNLASETALPESLVRPQQPTLVLTGKDVVDRIPSHRDEQDFRIWNASVALVGLPGEQ